MIKVQWNIKYSKTRK